MLSIKKSCMYFFKATRLQETNLFVQSKKLEKASLTCFSCCLKLSDWLPTLLC